MTQSFKTLSSSRCGLAVSSVVLLLAGCSSILPSSENTTKSAWASFQEVKAAYERLPAKTSSVADLQREKFHPDVNPQVLTLSHVDVVRRFFVPNMPVEFIDRGVQACLSAQDRCAAYELDVRHINKKRVGNALLDLTSFKRSTEISGWRFQAVFLVNDGVLVYKTWGGQADVSENENVNNPLGPVQTWTPSLFGK